MDVPNWPYTKFNEFGGISIWYAGMPDPPVNVPDAEEKVERATGELRRLAERMKRDERGGSNGSCSGLA